MDRKGSRGKEKSLLYHVGTCSKNMVYNHALDNLSEFVLHDLCSQKGFNIHRAAYLVHNPDFVCLKGVAGYNQPEAFAQESTWNAQKDFTSHMKKSPFNQKVRTYNKMHEKDISDRKIQEIVEYLEIDNPAYHLWTSKHNNQGLFIFDKADNDLLSQDHLLHFLHMLSFCPVF